MLTNSITSFYDDVISDVTADQFRLGFSMFRTCEYSNLISLHLMFTKLDMIDTQVGEAIRYVTGQKSGQTTTAAMMIILGF